jgi:hypothetical protein
VKQPLFRGYSVENGDWEYGHGWFEIDYTEEYKQEQGIEDRAILYRDNASPTECVMSSMGQYTGVNDRYSTKIFVGDILKIAQDRVYPQVVTFAEGFFQTDEFALFELIRDKGRSFEVIGNIFENPELIIA